MKKLLAIITINIALCINLFGQSPQKLTYQSVVRDGANQLVINLPVGLKLEIVQGSSNGNVVYSETHMPLSNQNGLITIIVGDGGVLTGVFSAIDWENGPYFLNTEIDPNGASNYSISSSSQLLSVPFALHANSSKRSSGFIVSPIGWNLNSSAGLEVNFADKGFLLPRVADTSLILSPVEGLEIYDLSSHCLRYRSNLAWSGCLFGDSTTISLPPTSGCVSGQSESAYSTVTNLPGAPGLTWITRNLGAISQASSATDTSPSAVGCYFQFNRVQGYTNDVFNTTGTVVPSWTITTISENSDWLISNDPCRNYLGGTWRLPTLIEWTNVDAAGSWQSDVDAFNSPLKLHDAGVLLSANGGLNARGLTGYYWSNTQSDLSNGWVLAIGNVGNLYSYTTGSLISKSLGNSVRCVK